MKPKKTANKPNKQTNKLTTKVYERKCIFGNLKEFVCAGYIKFRGKNIRIGEVVAERPKPGQARYLVVLRADLDRQYIGKGYGHVLYRRLAVFAKSKRLLGLKSRNENRNTYSNGAWRKIYTSKTSHYHYLHWSLKRRT